MSNGPRRFHIVDPEQPAAQGRMPHPAQQQAIAGPVMIAGPPTSLPGPIHDIEQLIQIPLNHEPDVVWLSAFAAIDRHDCRVFGPSLLVRVNFEDVREFLDDIEEAITIANRWGPPDRSLDDEAQAWWNERHSFMLLCPGCRSDTIDRETGSCSECSTRLPRPLDQAWAIERFLDVQRAVRADERLPQPDQNEVIGLSAWVRR